MNNTFEGNLFEKLTNQIQTRNWVKHLVFWFLIVVSFIARDRILDEHSLYVSLIRQICLLIPQVMVSYFLAYYWIPKYALAKQKIPYIIVLLFSIYLSCVLARVLIIYVSEAMTRDLPYKQESLLQIAMDWKKLLSEYFPPVFIVALGFLFLKFFIHYTNAKQNELKISKEKVETELNLLKAQLNPHFLFNTLNNIYALAVENSDKTAYSIEKLSEILDYVLYRCNDKYTPLSGEIKMLENYIELEKLRYDDRLQVTFEKHIDKDIRIAPLILLSFVENAFKHGAGEDSGSPKIDISVTYSEGVFVFMISNTIRTTTENDKKKIGLVNIRKQLDLLYPDLYCLEIDHSPVDQLFLVKLKIKITDEN